MFKRIKKAYQALIEPEGFEWTGFVKPANQSENVEMKVIARGNFVPNSISESTDDDGKAIFFGEGTTEEFEEQLRKDKGMDKWYKRILNP